MKENKPLVSVHMITYNHQAYIEEAIKGVFMQQCDFEIELIIANDNSTDYTHKRIESFIKNKSLPEHIQIHYHVHKENKGVMSNFVWTFQQCKGKYIAMCEGDDYWTDPLKLQKQVDFLEGNEGFAGCFHNANILFTQSKTQKPFINWKENQDIYETSDLFEKWLVPTASFMFRNQWNNDNFTNNLPPWITSIGSGDLALILLVSLKGKIKRLDENMAVYRKHSGGLTSNRAGDPIQFLILGHMLYNFNRETNNLYLNSIKNGFDSKLKSFYNPYFKNFYEAKQPKFNFSDQNKLYHQLGIKKIIKLLFFALKRKLFRV